MRERKVVLIRLLLRSKVENGGLVGAAETISPPARRKVCPESFDGLGVQVPASDPFVLPVVKRFGSKRRVREVGGQSDIRLPVAQGANDTDSERTERQKRITRDDRSYLYRHRCTTVDALRLGPNSRRADAGFNDV